MRRKKLNLDDLPENEKHLLDPSVQEPDPEPQAPPEPKKRARKKAAPAEESIALVSGLMDAADAQLIAAGASPMNPAQRALIRLGAEGVIRKYGLSMESYPEIVLGIGVAWTAVDKVSEIRKAKEASAESQSDQIPLFNAPS